MDFSNYLITPFALASILATLVSFAVAILLIPNLKQRTAKYLFALMSSITWYSLFTGIEYAAIDLNAKMFWTRVEYVAVLVTPALFLFSTLDFANSKDWLSKKRIGAVLVVPLITYIFSLTNDAHHLVWTTLRLSNDGNNLSILGHGPVFWVGVVGYSYLLVIIASSILIRESTRYLIPFRAPALLILISAITPLLGNVFYLFDFFTVSGYDPTSALFVISGGLYTLGIFRFKFLNFTPLAFTQLIGDLKDAVIGLDSNDCLVYFNKSAGRLMRSKNLAFLLDASGGIPKIGAELPFISKIMGDSPEKMIRVPGTNQYLKIKTNPMLDGRGQPVGTVIVIDDETSMVLAQVTQEQAASNKERLGSIYSELSAKLAEIKKDFDSFQASVSSTKQMIALEKLDHLKSSIKTIDVDLRQTVLDLSSQNLFHENFTSILPAYLDEYKLITGIKVSVSFPQDPIDNILPQTTFSTLFLFIQEALYLVQKHTKTKNVGIFLTVDENHLGLILTGDGDVISDELNKFNESVKEMIDRARVVKRKFECRSGENQGVQFLLNIDTLHQGSQFSSLVGLRVMIADQHQLFVDGLTPLLTEIGVNVVSNAQTTVAALASFEQQKPDLILIDPTLDGFFTQKFIPNIKRLEHPTKIVLLSDLPDEPTISKLLDDNFDGFLLKDRSVRQLAQALVLIVNGTKEISPELTERIYKAHGQQGSTRQKEAIQQLALARLNSNQIEILRLLLSGKVYKEIANTLSMTESSVKYHLDRVMTLLGVRNRNELVKYLYDIGLSEHRQME